MLGTTVDGRFLVRAPLGRGAMGLVFLADDLTAGGQVALKVIDAATSSAEGFTARFERETSVLARLSHPGVIRFVAAGRLPGGGPYYAMSLVEGETLADAIARRGRLSSPEVARLGARLADALAHVHDLGLLHRDLKPANVILTRDGDPILVDFGLARDPSLTALTATGMAIGTPAYMAPEQLAGDPGDGRTDLWQLGATLYQTLTGRLPFDQLNLVSLTNAIRFDAPPPPSRCLADCPPGWDKVLSSLMAKDRNLRPRDGREAAALLAALEKPAPPATSAPSHSSPADRRRRLWPLLAPVLLLLALALLRREGTSEITIRSLRAEGRPGGALVRWSTDEPSVSAVELVVPGSPPRTVSARPGAGPTRSHQILVDDLPEAAEVRVAVIRPDGRRSLTLATQTLRVVPRLLSIRPDPAGLALLVECPATTELTWAGRNGPEAAVRAGDGSFELTVPPRLEALTLERRGGDGSVTAVDLRAMVLERTGQAAALVAAITPKDMAALVGHERKDFFDRALAEVEGTAPRLDDARRAELNRERSKTLGTWLAGRGVPAAVAVLEAVAPILIDDPEVAATLKDATYAAVANLGRLRVATSRFGADDCGLPQVLPPMGSYSLTASPPPGAFHRIPLFPAEVRPMRIGLSLPTLNNPDQRDWLSGSFTVPGDREPVAACVVFSVRPFQFSTMRLVANGHDFIIWDRPVFPNHVGERPVNLYQTLPPGTIAAGLNAVELRFEWPYFDARTISIVIEDVALLWR